jgi:hypothetical protein
MQITEIRADYRKTVSDGNYGNETHAVAITATLGDEDVQEAAATLARIAEEHVIGTLKRSQNRGIRRALMTDEEREADYAAEHEEQQRRWRAQREADKRQGEIPLDESPV